MGIGMQVDGWETKSAHIYPGTSLLLFERLFLFRVSCCVYTDILALVNLVSVWHVACARPRRQSIGWDSVSFSTSAINVLTWYIHKRSTSLGGPHPNLHSVGRPCRNHTPYCLLCRDRIPSSRDPFSSL